MRLVSTERDTSYGRIVRPIVKGATLTSLALIEIKSLSGRKTPPGIYTLYSVQRVVRYRSDEKFGALISNERTEIPQAQNSTHPRFAYKQRLKSRALKYELSSWRSQTRIQSSRIALSVAYGIRPKPLRYSCNVLKLLRGTSNATKLVCIISIFREGSPEIAAWPRTIIGDHSYCNVDDYTLAPWCQTRAMASKRSKHINTLTRNASSALEITSHSKDK